MVKNHGSHLDIRSLENATLYVWTCLVKLSLLWSLLKFPVSLLNIPSTLVTWKYLLFPLWELFLIYMS